MGSFSLKALDEAIDKLAKLTDWRWPSFTRAELVCKCGCGRCEMDPAFMDALQALRNHYGRPMPVTSGYRCPDHNARVSNTGLDGPHTTGRAVDVAVKRGLDAWDLAFLAMSHGFTGIGVSIRSGQKGAFLHLDRLEGSGRLWSY